jgi:hypothetical protein
MKTLLTILILTSATCFGQLPKISTDWEKDIVANFENKELADYQEYDFSEIISNQLRIDRDPWSTYIGVFGPKNRRIDFHLIANKVDFKTYSVIGKSKLGQNIRKLSGEIHLRKIVETKWMASILIFEYKLDEPGDKDGDGSFVGIGAIAFMINENKPVLFWSEAGDYREYNNMFVGIWNRNNSDVSRECIFSFNPSGTHTTLPYRDYLYKEFEPEDECKCYFEIKDEYRQYGWENYDDSDGYKDYWWK